MTDMNSRLKELILKKSTLWNRNHKELTHDEFHEMMEEQYNPVLVINKLADDEIKKLINEIHSPLLALYHGGYREYINEIEWNCCFCGKKIERHEGYWGCKDMSWSKGPKSCHKCFFKFLLMMEDNSILIWIFKMIKDRDLDGLRRIIDGVS